MTSTPFIVMIKPVSFLCNMRCDYCYYLKDQKAEIMNYQILEETIKQISESTVGNVISFQWHGGEPLLAGIEFYQKAVELEKKYCPKGKYIWNNIQTNGTLINEQWAKFFKENNFDIGVSIDGSETTHNKHRHMSDGKDSYQLIKDNIELLKSYDIKPDLLCTVNNDVALHPLETYNSLKQFNTGWIQFIPIVNQNRLVSSYNVEAKQYGNFLNTIFDVWCKNDIGKLDIQLFSETSLKMATGVSQVCWLQKKCGNVLVVEADGNIYSCDHFVNEENLLGNIITDSLNQCAHSEKQQKFAKKKYTALSEKCHTCPYLYYCQGGCLKDRKNNQSLLCDGLQTYYSHALPIIKQMIELSRQGYNAEQIKEFLQK